MVKILDANYEKTDHPELIRTKIENLIPSEQAKLLEALTEFEDLKKQVPPATFPSRTPCKILFPRKMIYM